MWQSTAVNKMSRECFTPLHVDVKQLNFTMPCILPERVSGSERAPDAVVVSMVFYGRIMCTDVPEETILQNCFCSPSCRPTLSE